MTASENNVDPFRLLVVRRSEAEAAGLDLRQARKRAVDEACTVIVPFAKKKANFFFSDGYVRGEAAQEASISLQQHCGKIYDREVDPPKESWKGYIATTVWNSGHDVRRRESHHGFTKFRHGDIVVSLDAPDLSGNPVWTLLPVAGAEDAELIQVSKGDLLRQLSQLRAAVESVDQVCVFHPGRHCEHVGGRHCASCRNSRKIFDAIESSIILEEPVKTLLIKAYGLRQQSTGQGVGPIRLPVLGLVQVSLVTRP